MANNEQSTWGWAALVAGLLLVICCAALPMILGGVGLVGLGVIQKSPWLLLLGIVVVALAAAGFLSVQRRSRDT